MQKPKVVVLLLQLLLAFPISAQIGAVSIDTNPLPAIIFEHLGGQGFMAWNGQWNLVEGGALSLSPSTTGATFRVQTDNAGLLELASRDRRLRYIVDSSNFFSNQGIFSWHEHTTADGDRLMQLQASDGGDLFIGGQLTQNTSFDLAETFWKGEPVEAGEIVMVDPGRGDAVRRTRESYQHELVGVVSERPGIVLGGGAFSLASLREAWGDEVADSYEAQRPDLETRVLAASGGLREEAERVASPAAFGAFLQAMRETSQARGDDPQGSLLDQAAALARRSDPRPKAFAKAYEEARASFETALFDETIRLFYAERFARIALAGRVPVRADASFGAIRAGDPLTSSPVPGVAMKATAPGPILGIALESLAGGSGRVLTLVDRGWYGGEARNLASADPGRAQTEALLAAREREIEDLRDRLAALEARLGMGGTKAFAATTSRR